tara:strand:+ start:3855 stop:4145 length:291 start_codon:yes stop_codon:yes gene_type:complete
MNTKHEGMRRGSSPRLGFCRYLIMTNFQTFTPQELTQPVAIVSEHCEQLVLDVLDKSWHKVSSGLAPRYSVEELISIQEQELLDEYREEYASANAW